MIKINRLVLDASASMTDLCTLGARYGTDKSPYSSTWHHHPYTAAYDLLFASMRYRPIVLGELGILDNKSMHLWRHYFPQATLYGFEYDQAKIDLAKAENIPGSHYSKADVSNKESMFNAFNDVGRMFDILIDDSTHFFEHQIKFVEVSVDFVGPGGILIVEDVFRGWGDARYTEALAPLLDLFSSATFIETNHDKAYSGGNTTIPYFDNDKLLVLHRNQNMRAVQCA